MSKFSYHCAALTLRLAGLPEPPFVPDTLFVSLPTTVPDETSSTTTVPEQSVTAPTSLIQTSENTQHEQVTEDTAFLFPCDDPLPLADHLSKITAQVYAIGDSSMSAYQAMLSRLECLQEQFSRFCADATKVLPSSPTDHLNVTVKLPGIFVCAIY